MSLKLIFKDICKDLGNVENVSQTFEKVKDDWERFSIAYNLSQKYFTGLQFKCTCKCNDLSATFRKEGNKLFISSFYWKALVLYNKSIAFALNGSEELGIAYGNRASCLLRLTFPHEALQDVEKALSLCASNKFKEKLLARKNQCLLLIKKIMVNTVKVPFGCGEIPSLSRKRSTFFDCASNVLELSYDEYSERKLVANDNIKIGEVLIVEKPFSSIVLPTNFYTHCSKCFKRNLNLIPCLNCVTAMFCSEECSNSVTHETECLYLNILTELNADRRELLSLKVLTIASNHGKELEDLHAAITDKALSKVQNYEFYNSLDFINVFNLVTNSSKRKAADLFYRSIISVILVFILENYSNFFSKSSEKNRSNLRIFCGGLLLKFMQSLPCNAHEVSEYSSSSLQEIGAGAYSTLSLINHSCDPNVVRYCNRDEIILRAIKPIIKGEEILDNYGYHYATHNLYERQSALLEQYYFKCKCEACTHDWPLFTLLLDQPLKIISEVDMTLFKELTDEFEKDLQKVLEGKYDTCLITKNMDYLEFLHKVVQRPWVNYNKCQELIKHCLNFQSNYFQLSSD